jgi:NTE family protein
VNNTPLSHAVALGADVIWVLPTGYSCALPESPKGALAMALPGLTLTVNQRLAIDVAHFESRVDLRSSRRCARSESHRRTSPSRRSSQSGSHAAARQWLSSRHPVTGEAALLEPHRH